MVVFELSLYSFAAIYFNSPDLALLSLRQMARDRTRKSQEATNDFGTWRNDAQVLSESPRKERFEEDIFVPQSAPAWMGTFGLRYRDRNPNTSCTTQSSSSREVRILRFLGNELK